MKRKFNKHSYYVCDRCAKLFHENDTYFFSTHKRGDNADFKEAVHYKACKTCKIKIIKEDEGF